MTQNNEVKVKITGDNSDVVAKADQTVAKFNAGATAMGAAMAGAGTTALKFANDFDNAFDKIAVGTGASGQALKDYEDTAREVFRNVPVSIGAASKAVGDFATALGEEGGPALQRLSENALNATRLTGESIEGLTETAGKAFTLFNLDAERSADALDAVFVAAQKTGVPMNKLLGILNAYGPVLKNLGFGFEESVALIAGLQKAGLDVSRVMPGINAAMRRWTDDGITNLRGKLNETIASIKNATTTTEALNIATDAFGAEGAQRLTTAIRDGAIEIDALTQKMLGSQGAIDETAARTDDWREKLTLLKNEALLTAEPVLEVGGAALTAAGSMILIAGNIGAATEAARGLGPAIRNIGVAARVAAGPLGVLAVALGAAFAASELISTGDGGLRDLERDLENLSDPTLKIARLQEEAANATGLYKEAIEGSIEELEKDIEAKERAAERTSEFEDAQADAARATGDFSQKIEDINSAFEDMTGSASDAFGAINQFKNVPTTEQLAFQAQLSIVNAEIARQELALANASNASDEERESIQRMIDTLEEQAGVLEAEIGLLDATRQRTIDVGNAKLAASGQVDGMVGSERELNDAVRDATRSMAEQERQARTLEQALEAVRRAGPGAPEPMAGDVQLGFVYHSGTPFVPRTGPALLERGEAVIPASENPNNPSAVFSRANGNGSIMLFIDNVNVGGQQDSIADLGFGLDIELASRGIR